MLELLCVSAALWLCDTVANEMLNGVRKPPVACGAGTVADTKAFFTTCTRAADAKNPRASWRSGDPFGTLATACTGAADAKNPKASGRVESLLVL